MNIERSFQLRDRRRWAFLPIGVSTLDRIGACKLKRTDVRNINDSSLSPDGNCDYFCETDQGDFSAVPQRERFLLGNLTLGKMLVKVIQDETPIY